MKRTMNLSASKKGTHLGGFNSKSTHTTKSFSSLQLSLFDNTEETTTLDDVEFFNIVQHQILPIVKTYQELMNEDRINEEQSDILEKILKLSEANPILCQMLSIVDENLPVNEDEMSKEFSKQLKQRLGNDAYQAWREVRFM
jgi:hypothetical protein